MKTFWCLFLLLNANLSLAQSADIAAIDSLTARLYAAISFEPGEQPPLDQLPGLFYPGARMISNGGAQPRVLTVDEYLVSFQGGIKNGNIPSFVEDELWQRTEIFGNVAHRFSTYVTYRSRKDEKPFMRGINSIQFIKADGRWYISSIAWSDERGERKIPEQYLEKSGRVD